MRVIILAAALAISGCASIQTPLDEGYQFGDTTGSVLELQARYCAEADPYRRAILLALAHQVGVPLPSRGACADVLDVVSPEDLEAIDVEAAESDRRRFEEMRDAGVDSQAAQDGESPE